MPPNGRCRGGDPLSRLRGSIPAASRLGTETAGGQTSKPHRLPAERVGGHAGDSTGSPRPPPGSGPPGPVVQLGPSSRLESPPQLYVIIVIIGIIAISPLADRSVQSGRIPRPRPGGETTRETRGTAPQPMFSSNRAGVLHVRVSLLNSRWKKVPERQNVGLQREKKTP